MLLSKELLFPYTLVCKGSWLCTSDVEEKSREEFVSEKCAVSKVFVFFFLAIHFQIHLNDRLGMKMKNLQHSVRIIKHC